MGMKRNDGNCPVFATQAPTLLGLGATESNGVPERVVVVILPPDWREIKRSFPDQFSPESVSVFWVQEVK